MTARCAGKLLVTEFNAADKETLEELLRWKTLSLEGLDASYNPTRFSVKGVSLSDFFAAITIESDGTLNLHQLMVAEEAAKQDEKTPARPPAAQGAVPSEPPITENVEIGGITLQGGTIKFTDKYIKPSYSANLTQIGGRVSSLSMKKDTAADVEVRGKLNDYVPLEITGKVNPWEEHYLGRSHCNHKKVRAQPPFSIFR